MSQSAIRSTLPYVVGLVVAAILFHYAQQIEYTPRHGSLGPRFWPEMAIGLMAIVCLFEVGRGLLGLNKNVQGIGEVLEQQVDAEEIAEEKMQTYPWLLVGGIALVTVYAVVVDILGFLLSTFLFLACFMYLGGYRRHLRVWLTSTAVTFAAALLFMRIAYVSLPRGIPPFDGVTDAVRIILGG